MYLSKYHCTLPIESRFSIISYTHRFMRFCVKRIFHTLNPMKKETEMNSSDERNTLTTDQVTKYFSKTESQNEGMVFF